MGCHGRPVKSLRISLVTGLAVLTGCQSLPFIAPHYTHFRVTNYRGELLADWTAEGDYGRVGPAYKIKAVERVSGLPYSVETHYPNGWRTTVDGPHIVHWRTPKPLWLVTLDRN